MGSWAVGSGGQPQGTEHCPVTAFGAWDLVMGCVPFLFKHLVQNSTHLSTAIYITVKPITGEQTPPLSFR